MNAKKKNPAKKTDKKPEPRHVWEINPVPRVQEDETIYERAREKEHERREIDQVIDFFGE